MDGWTPEQRRAFGQRLREARKGRGMTLADVGAMFDTGKATVGHWETGTNMPSAEQLARMADEFGVPADKLLFDREAPTFSRDLEAALRALTPAEFLRAENRIRVDLNMPLMSALPHQRPQANPQKQVGDARVTLGYVPPEASPVIGASPGELTKEPAKPTQVPRFGAQFDPPQRRRAQKK